ncbi:MAG: alpha/beta fold hydrolase [Dehalococcoidales bacterium]
MANNGIQSLKIKVNSWQAHYLKAGNGPPVVLIHGGASDARDWIGTMTALSGHFSFYALDLLGYGQSEKNESGYYLSDFTDFLVGFIDALKLEKPALAGHSLGGRFCLDVAIKNQTKVSKLVLIDTTGLGNMSAFGNALQIFFWSYRKIFRKPQPFPNFLMKPGEKFHHNYDAELRRLKIPTLLVWKSIDPYLPVSIGRRAVKKIPGAKLAVLNGYGHAPHQKDSEEFNKILLDFLSSS